MENRILSEAAQQHISQVLTAYIEEWGAERVIIV